MCVYVLSKLKPVIETRDKLKPVTETQGELIRIRPTASIYLVDGNSGPQLAAKVAITGRPFSPPEAAQRCCHSNMAPKLSCKEIFLWGGSIRTVILYVYV